jgi:PTH1 family peptidyl-tRNA hydrolase
MKIFIVGLGNPGKEYQKSPHNLGFEVIDKLARKWGLKNFQESRDKKYLFIQGKFGKKQVILVKPLTYMNNSGKAIRSLIKNLKAKKENVWLIHDEIDLPTGKIKIVVNKSSAGHKGVESVIKALKSKNFTRFRIGSCPFRKKLLIKDVKKFLLSPYSPSKWKEANKGVRKAVKAIELALEKNLATAMTKFNAE